MRAAQRLVFSRAPAERMFGRSVQVCSKTSDLDRTGRASAGTRCWAASRYCLLLYRGYLLLYRLVRATKTGFYQLL
jgi:hypothetical protein